LLITAERFKKSLELSTHVKTIFKNSVNKEKPSRMQSQQLRMSSKTVKMIFKISRQRNKNNRRS